jgi:hypothetical protein
MEQTETQSEAKVKSQYHAIVQTNEGVHVYSNPIRAALRKQLHGAVTDGAQIISVIKGKQIPFGTKVVETLSIG